MTNSKLICLLLILFTSFLAGCGSNPSDSGTTQILTPESNGIASLNVVLTPETVASIRATTTIYTVKVILLVANPGNSAAPYTKLVKVVDISAGSANVSFTAVEAKPVVVKVLLDNATLAGSRSFHAAMDLVANTTNTITPVAAGAGSTADLIARVALEFFNNSSLMAGASNSLTAAIQTATTGLTDFNIMLTSAVTAISPSGFVKLEADTTPTSLKIGTMTRTAAQTWLAGELWTTTPANMQVKTIVRQGFDGFGLVHWAHASENDNGISKVGTADGSKSVYCRNFGKLSHFLTLPDGSILVAGFNNVKNAPVLFRWDGTTNASTYSTSGLSDSGVKWSNYFTDVATDLSGYSIEVMSTDSDSIVYVILKKPDNSKVEYRINLATGGRAYLPGSPEEGKTKIIAYHTEMEAILENNSLSDATRTTMFMAYIAEDFKDIDGNPDKKPELQSTTLSRLERYIINKYEFTPGTATIVDANTITVVTNMLIDVTRKPGAAGSISAAYIPLPNQVLTWKRYGTEWKIYQGLPYKSSEIQI